jgi:hypothetical protein
VAAVINVYSPDGATLLGTLPEYADLQVQQDFNAEGAINFNYPRSGTNAALLDVDDAVLVISENGVERDDVYILEDDGDDPADQDGNARPIQVGGRGAGSLLERSVVYPATHTPGSGTNGLDPHFKFVTSTPGAILKTLIDRAKARFHSGIHGLPYVTYDFTASVDSNGTAWTEVFDVTYDMGVNLLQVLTDGADKGWWDWRMDRLGLRLYPPDGGIADRPNVVLYQAQSVGTGPRKRTRRPIRSVMVVLGDENVSTEAVNSAALTRWGLREGYEAQSGIANQPTLDAVATARLFLVSKASEGFTVDSALDAPASPQPGIDFLIGDKIRYDQRRLDSTNYEPMRVSSIATTWDTNGIRSCSVELNDLFLDASLRLARKIDGITSGSTSNSTIVTPGRDTTIPNAPTLTNGNVTSFGVVDLFGNSSAEVSATWTGPNTNTDNSGYADHDYYIVQAKRLAATDWQQVGTPDQPPLAWANVPLNVTIQVRVAAVDLSGNRSAWSSVATHTTVGDTTPPPVPSQPTAVTRLGVITVGWDGLGNTGQGMPADFRYVNVHLSATNNFTPSSSTRIAQMRTRGTVQIADQPYNQIRYVKLTSVDAGNNESVGSLQTQVTVTPLVDTDLIGQVIDAAHIVNGTLVASDKIVAKSITAAQIAALTIQAGNIAANAITSDKIIAGAIDGQLITGATIRTGLTDRVQMDSFGLTLFGRNASNALVTKVWLNQGTGKAYFLGPGDITPTSTLHPLQIGADGAKNMAVDVNEIMARDPNQANAHGVLSVNREGGRVNIGGYTNYDGNGSFGGARADPDFLIQLRGYVNIENTVDGQYSGVYSPLTIGKSDGQHMWLDQENIGSRNSDGTVRPLRLQPPFSTGTNHNVETFIGSNSVKIYRTPTSGNGCVSGVPSGQGQAAIVFNDGGSNPSTVRVVAATDLSNFQAIQASAFTVSSSTQVKQNITDVPGAGAVVKGARGKKWKYKTQYVARDTRFHFGPLAEDLPTEMVDTSQTDIPGGTINIGDVAGMAWEAARRVILYAEDLETRLRAAETAAGITPPAVPDIDDY